MGEKLNLVIKKETIKKLVGKVDKYLLLLVLIMVACYAICMWNSSAYQCIRIFSTKIVMGTAQVARNTLRGNFFQTKYILPVSYAYFPEIENHPDFFRPVFQVILYTFLFFLTSPSALVIKLFNAFLFVFNGCLIYWLVLKLKRSEAPQDDEQISNRDRIVAILTAVCSSVFFVDYLMMALQDYYELITYSLMLVTLHVILEEKKNPILLGVLFGLMYLSKPNMAIFAFAFTLYVLIFQTKSGEWFKIGLLCVLGFFVIQIPFIIRSMAYTGEPFFSIQQKIDIIKGIDLSHNELYRTFDLPSSAKEIILNNLPGFFAQWKSRVLRVITYLFEIDKIVYWIAFPFFIAKFRKNRKLAAFYILFLVIHVLFISFILESRDTVRTYRYLYSFIVVLSLAGAFSTLAGLLEKISNELQTAAVIAALLLLPVFTNMIDLSAGVNSVGHIPNSIAEDIREINPACLYSNSPYEASWYLDISTIYIPVDYSEMLNSGPAECKYFFYIDKEDAGLEEFLEDNASLVYQNLGYYLYHFSQ